MKKLLLLIIIIILSACDGNDIRSSTETNKLAAASFPSD
jgi:hypothetical protein